MDVESFLDEIFGGQEKMDLEAEDVEERWVPRVSDEFLRLFCDVL